MYIDIIKNIVYWCIIVCGSISVICLCIIATIRLVCITIDHCKIGDALRKLIQLYVKQQVNTTYTIKQEDIKQSFTHCNKKYKEK